MPVNPKSKDCVSDEMKRWKAGNLHSGEDGPVVKNRKQAIAIALSSCGKSKSDHVERLQSMGFSEEVAAKVAQMLDFSNANLDWAKQFESGKGPGKNMHPDLGPSDRKHPGELVSKASRKNNPEQDEPEMLSGVSLPKGPANPQGGSSKDVQGLRMLG
jgi:hypothetical protein